MTITLSEPGTVDLLLLEPAQYEAYLAGEPFEAVWSQEGVSATVSVEGSKTHRALKVNGKTDASNVGDRATQIGVVNSSAKTCARAPSVEC